MNTDISFSIAKLLEEKGYDEPCANLYYEPERCKKPTIADVVMWLYEKHGIWIDVSLNQFSKPNDLQWMYSIIFTSDCTYSHSPKSYNSPTEAYEAAIEYILKSNLI